MNLPRGPRALVCGSRSGQPTREEALWLRAILRRHHVVELVHGGATGYDSWAGRIASRLELPVKIFEAHWTGHNGEHRPWAGPERNRLMIGYICKFPGSLVVAFPGGTGTASTIWYAEKHGTPILRSPR
jgi:hypothetical protein